MKSGLAMITFLGGRGDGAVDPGYGVPGGGQIDNSLPGGIQLPPGAAQLPVFPFDPTIDNSLPGGRPDRPDNSLPGGMPPRVDNTLPSGGNRPSHQPIHPGAKFVVKWLACVGLILVPDNTLPSTPQPK
jgi:hypothetical protein